jgi:hypothetical protein
MLFVRGRSIYGDGSYLNAAAAGPTANDPTPDLPTSTVILLVVLGILAALVLLAAGKKVTAAEHKCYNICV